MKIYNNNKMYEKTLEFYKQYKSNIIPDHVTFICLLFAAAKLGSIEQCQMIVDDLRSRSIFLDNNDILQVNLICGDMSAG